MPKLTGVTSLRRAGALGKHLSIKGWGARSVIIAAVSVFVLAACEPAEPTPVGVAPIETSETEEPVFEWVRAMPDPRPAFDKATQKGSPLSGTGAEAKGYPEKEIWCVPGCLLASNPDGSPMVPEWCTAWGVSGTSYFARENVDGDLAPDPAIIQSEVQQKGQDRREMMCTRINFDRLTSSSTTGASGALRSIDLGPVKVSRWNGNVVGMNCLPGCVTPWNIYGYRGETIEMQMQMPRENSMRLPEWCAMGTDGCRESGTGVISQCGPADTKMSVCTRLKFTDSNKELPNVE